MSTIKPERIVFEQQHVGGMPVLQLKVFSRDLPRGYTVIEQVRRINGKSIPSFRKRMAAYAKRWNIPSEDRVND
jgi:hypothetical protein